MSNIEVLNLSEEKELKTNEELALEEKERQLKMEETDRTPAELSRMEKRINSKRKNGNTPYFNKPMFEVDV